MAGQASGGQTLTPNRNVNAPAGYGGDKWGAYGGGITPVGGGVSGQTGYGKPIAATVSDGETAANYEQAPIPTRVKGGPTLSVQSQTSVAALSQQTLDSALAANGSNQG